MNRRSRILALMAFFAAVSIIPIGVRLPTKITFNPSPSAPIGFYWIGDGSLKRGAFAVVPTPPAFRLMAAERRYIPINVELIKRVIGLAGDEICRIENDVFVNGKKVARALNEDSQGRLLPIWTGCVTLGDEQFFALMDAPDSFDGRYFGPLNKNDVTGIATPLFTWSHDVGRSF